MSDISSLAMGVGDRGTVGRLLAGEFSRRVLLIRHLLDLASAQPSVLSKGPSAEDAWRELIVLDRAAKPALVVVLLHPQVGTWLATAIRILTGKASATGPLWVEVGQIHSVIFAAAVRGGLTLTTRVPVRQGRILLPTLGLAEFSATDAWDTADAVTANGHTVLRAHGEEVQLPANPVVDGAGWMGLRQISSRADGRVWNVWLDDIDPYRDLSDPVPPDRLSSGSVQRWASLLDEAWHLLTAEWPEYCDGMAAGLTSISPLPDDPHSQVIRSASTGDGFGAALMSCPPDATALAMTLVHEFQHIKLGGLLHLVPLHEEGHDTSAFYAPWRDDPRPLAGLFQGTYAFLGITEFWSRHWLRTSDATQSAWAAFEFAYARRQTWAALRSLIKSSKLTERGSQFVGRMALLTRSRLSRRVPRGAARAAWAVAADHRAIWRLRNLTPSPRLVHALSDAWRFGYPASHVGRSDLGDTSLTPAVGHVIHARLALQRARILAPARFAEWTAEPTTASERVAGATPADVILVAAEPGRSAYARFHERVVADPDDVHAWAGLGLAAAVEGIPQWRPLVYRPELVRAVYRSLLDIDKPAEPEAVASWLGRA